MSKFLEEISKEDIINAIKYLDKNPEDFKGRLSSTYNLLYEGKEYPPILVLSKANELKGGSELLLRDFNNNTDTAFIPFYKYGFTIINKKSMEDGYSIYLKEFIRQSKTDNLTYKKYAIDYLGTSVRASFGKGNTAKVPWISFTIAPQTTSKGIYPVYLYYNDLNLLILAYGISEENKSLTSWCLDDDTITINEYFKLNGLGTPYRYGASSVYKIYNTDKLPSDEELNNDLKNIINKYKLDLSKSTNNSHSDFKIEYFKDSLSKSNLQLSDALVKRFVASLVTKPFVILTGLAGSGKTKLSQSFIQYICESEEQYKIVAVGADWINREPLLGYPNGLNIAEYVMPDNGVLELILKAIDYQHKPYFLVLDEMNLSHVERYFADFLSIMESSDSIKLYTGAERNSTNGLNIPQTIFWPKNLFIIGTVNIDETTYMFSPKVLDRANVIEFRLDENDLSRFLSNPKKVDLSQLVGNGADMAASFLAMSHENDTSANEELNNTLVLFFKELKSIGAEFGYRSAFEIHLLYAQLTKLDQDLSVYDKVDFALMQKLLPKLHGSRSKIVKTLEALIKLCLHDTSEFNIAKLENIQLSNVKYKLSFDKLKRMYFNALNNGFTSYAEA
ncbi:McrB family protein [Sphingobacterium mizutaii]|uniref:McrB family protein n=1 Tax=Sphingobacterium mizutaii TaxID=1010 RepID=UPI0028A7AAC5|nr:DUF3578 domain-containing protein [Sphingobacterium mizutaii]